MENEQRQSQENREIDTEKNFLKTFEENFKHYSYEKKKRTILLMLAISFIFGFIVKGCTSVSRKTYSELLTENQKIQQTLDDTKKDYDNYKTKMHPYELQQAADVKAAQEKKAEEEKAKIDAENKAIEEKKAEEEAEKKQLQETLKKQSLGISPIDFQTKFNQIASTNGYDIFLGGTPGETGTIKFTALNPDVYFLCNEEGGFTQSLSITIKRTTSESMQDASYYIIATSLVLDSSLSVSSADSLLTSLINGSKSNMNKDYKVTKNGIDYIANLSDTNIFFYFAKSKQ